MIPSEVTQIADLLVPEGWRDSTIEDDVLKAAWRIYNAGATELPDDEMQKEMDAALAPYCKQVTETPALLSLLYDIDLLPEQIRLPVNVNRMIAVCELFRRVPPDAIADMMSDGPR